MVVVQLFNTFSLALTKFFESVATLQTLINCFFFLGEPHRCCERELSISDRLAPSGVITPNIHQALNNRLLDSPLATKK